MSSAGEHLNIHQLTFLNIGRRRNLRLTNRKFSAQNALRQVPDHFVQIARRRLIQQRILTAFDPNLVALNRLSARYIGNRHDMGDVRDYAHLGPHREIASAMAYESTPHRFLLHSGGELQSASWKDQLAERNRALTAGRNFDFGRVDSRDIAQGLAHRRPDLVSFCLLYTSYA